MHIFSQFVIYLWFCLQWFWSTENWGLSNWLYWFFFFFWLAFTTLLERPSLFQKYIFVLLSLFPLHLWSDQIIGLRQVSVILTMILSWLIMASILQRPFFCSAWVGKEFLYVSHGTQPQHLTEPSLSLKWSAVRNCLISRPAGVMSKCQVSPTPGL